MISRALSSIRFRLRRRWRRVVMATMVRPRLGAAELGEAMAGIGAPHQRVVMVHSSLSACGYVKGGAKTVIAALRQWSTGRTLAMPAHSFLYEREDGSCPVFDRRRSPSLVGEISNTYWRQAGVRRSLHPTHSIAAEGPDAEALIAGHENCDTPCGPDTPYHRIVEWDGGVLMFGTTLDAYTLFHTAEDAAQVPYLYEPGQCVLKLRAPGGGLRLFPMRRQDMKVARRFAAMDTWLETRNLLHRHRFGRGDLLWLPHAAAVHEAVVAALRANPRLLV